MSLEKERGEWDWEERRKWREERREREKKKQETRKQKKNRKKRNRFKMRFKSRTHKFRDLINGPLKFDKVLVSREGAVDFVKFHFVLLILILLNLILFGWFCLGHFNNIKKEE